MKLVAQSCLFCSWLWIRAALQKAAPAAADRTEEEEEEEEEEDVATRD